MRISVVTCAFLTVGFNGRRADLAQLILYTAISLNKLNIVRTSDVWILERKRKQSLANNER